MSKYHFPDHFIWGAATSSYQIEGAPEADGKGESIWDRFTRSGGNILDNATGDIACDHYRRYEEDGQLMAGLGLQAYRFSISWPRLFPAGGGRPNKKGLDFYRRLVDQLQGFNIAPFATLYHWDLPQALQEKGGWTNRDTAKYFAEYAAFTFENLDLPVRGWITINEPWVAAFLGHAMGLHAPGWTDFNLALDAAHNLLLGHGLALQRFREQGRKDEEIGIALNLTPIHPFSESEEDRAAARRTDGFMNRWFLDPLLEGAYPQDMVDLYRRHFKLPPVEEGDMEIISGPLDFLGINNYTRHVVKTGDSESDLTGNFVNPPESEYTEMGWEVYPRGLYELLSRIGRDYGPIPLYITENGAAFPDQLEEDGAVNDQARINYLQSYILEAWQALEEGAPLKGYFVWSLMDNFEWTFGYSKRFGLIYINYQTLERRWKKSAYWYRKVISRNGLDL